MGDEEGPPPAPASDGAPLRAPVVKRRRLELNGLKFDSPGAAFDFGVDLTAGRPSRRTASLSSGRSSPASTPSIRTPVASGLSSASAAASTSASASTSALPASASSSAVSAHEPLVPLVSSPRNPLPTSDFLDVTPKQRRRRSSPSKQRPSGGANGTPRASGSRSTGDASSSSGGGEPPSSAPRGGEWGSLQRRLDEVHNQHDMMVRELFHLTKFVTYVGYDPETAKQDRSHVFEHFRAENGLDLESKLATGPSSRATRRVVSRRMHDLALNGGQENAKGKQKAEDPIQSASGKASRDSSKTSSPRSLTAKPAKVAKQRRISVLPLQGKHRSQREASSDVELLRYYHERTQQQQRSLPTEPPDLAAMAYKQIPSPFSHDSLRDFFASFRYLDLDPARECLTPDEADLWEAQQTESYRRIDSARREGFLADEPASASARRPLPEPVGSKDGRSSLMSQIAKRQHRMRNEHRQRRVLARKVSRMVQAYWQSKEGTGERERKAEERHLRALAKWTVRQVNKQWKLAVNVVRAKKAKQAKMERERAGREQLSKILEQSTRYLGQREEDLKRGHFGAMDDEDDDASSSRDDSEGDEDGGETESDVYSVVDDGEDEDSGDEDSGDEAHEHVNGRASSARSSTFPSQTPEDTRHLASLLDINGDAHGQDFSRTPSHDDEPAFPLLDTSASSREGSTPPTSIGGGPTVRPQISSGANPRIVDLSRQSPSASDYSFCSGPVDASNADGTIVEASDAGDGDSSGDSVVDDDHDDSRSAEDATLERQMRQEDESEDGEDAGLMEDADLPIEELMKRYGYGQGAGDGGDGGGGGDVSDASDGEEGQLDSLGGSDDDDAKADVLSSHSARSPSAAVGEASLRPPFLLRGTLRPYQQTGFEWLASLYANKANGILADEMGLGKTIQTITLLAHLACDRGNWGPHLVIAPTSVMLNWEVEFKKFLPGFKILSYFGTQKERKEKRVGWNTEHSFNVCITSYQLVIADQHIFRRKPWVYMILDEAHHIKNFRSQRWQTLLGFNSERRLLLTGTPLQNNLMDLWSLMYFLMPNGLTDVAGAGAFANMKDFQEWFSNPLDRAVESGGGAAVDEETRAMVAKLHTILRPFLLRRLKSEVEKELPQKYEHVIRCRLSKRQRFLYNDFMSRAKTRESLASGSYMSIINCLMQLRKVCNHPDLFEVRPISTAFAMQRSVVADFEPQELLIRKRLLAREDEARVDLLTGPVSFGVTHREEGHSLLTTRMTRRLDASDKLPYAKSPMPPKPPLDLWTVEGYRKTLNARRYASDVEKWKHRVWVNRQRTRQHPTYGSTLLARLRCLASDPLRPDEGSLRTRLCHLDRCDAVRRLVTPLEEREAALADVIDRFACVPPKAMALDVPQHALGQSSPEMERLRHEYKLDASLHRAATKLQIAFPDASLLQYDCGKLQELERLMRRLKEGSHRILIFTQMTRVLDILEAFLNLHGYRYLRLDGATKVDRRQALTEKFNRDTRIDAFILSTRSGGLGINLTGADTVLFYDLDWNSAIEAQCMDRAHRIGQTRDVHIYRFVSEATIEENMLKKADQKRLLDSMVIQKGEFTMEHLKRGDWRDMLDDGGKTLAGVTVGAGDDLPAPPGGDEDAIAAVEDEEDRVAAKAAREEMVALDDTAMTDFAREDQSGGGEREGERGDDEHEHSRAGGGEDADADADAEEDAIEDADADEEVAEDEEGAVDDYMLRVVETDWEWFTSGFKV
ncbi:unnamed protein product [Parajaminaea phylloscopi]